MDDDIVRFIVATDNHLGFGEKDPVRCNDCFASFEEVLKTAKKKKVDFVLLAGDLFHENKPSRRTLHATMELLRKYCLNSDPIFIEILNEQEEIFKSSMGKVNYEDPYQSIGLPIFSIHGNHDDPSREGGSGESLAALDLLAVSNLINYYGKADNLDGIEVTPILIKKGNTKIALYGLGAIRDERLNRMWNLKKVKFVRLTEDQGRDDFFSIFVLHQNRDYGRGSKNCIHESMIPSWMDLVIWGNEHECQPQLMESLIGNYRILQPGSSIACSLSKPESSACPKHMAFFEVKERKFRMKPIKFQQIRQFLYDEVSLQDDSNINPTDPKVDEKVWNFLKQKVDVMIREARMSVAAEDPSDEPQRFTIKDPEKVLIRLRLDHDGFAAVNQQRFGSQYVGAVANPSEILLLARKRKEYGRTTEANNKDIKDEIRQIFAAGVEEEISKIKIEDLVKDALSSNRNSLSLLLEDEMAQALDDYIMKKQNDAILDVVSVSLDRIQRQLARDQAVQDGTQISTGISRARELIEKQKPAKPLPIANANAAVQLGINKAPTTARASAVAIDIDDTDVPMPSNSSKASSSRAKASSSKAKPSEAPKKNARAAKGKAKYADSDDEDNLEDEEMDVDSIAEEELEDEDEISFPESEDEKPKRKPSAKPKAAAAPKASTRKAPAAKKPSSKKNVQNLEEDDIVDSDEVSMPAKRGKASSSSSKVSIPKEDFPAPPPSIPLSQSTQGKSKRQLPLSFSQVSTTSKGKSSSKTVDLAWDD